MSKRDSLQGGVAAGVCRLFVTLVLCSLWLHWPPAAVSADPLPTSQPATQAATTLPADAPAWVKAAMAAFGPPRLGWESVRWDDVPSVTVGDRKGLRLLVRWGAKEYLDLEQRQLASSPEELRSAQFVMRYWHTEIVAFPGGELPPAAADKIAWTQWADELPTSKKAVHMGQGMGMDWYARATIYDQEHLRQALALHGGDDRLALLTQAIMVDNDWACVLSLAAAGDKAIPYIKAAIDDEIDGWRTIAALGFIQTDAATAYLKELYQEDWTRSAAAGALLQEPFRPAAKAEYLDMLRRGRVSQAAKASVQFDWKEAVPLLDAIYKRPRYIWEFEAAFRAMRTLEGRPVPAEIDQALKELEHWRYSEQAPTTEDMAGPKAALLGSKDTEAAIVETIRAATFSSKGGGGRVEIWRSVLRELPRKETAEIIERLANALAHDPFEAQRVRELLKEPSTPPIGGTTMGGPMVPPIMGGMGGSPGVMGSPARGGPATRPRPVR